MCVGCYAMPSRVNMRAGTRARSTVWSARKVGSNLRMTTGEVVSAQRAPRDWICHRPGGAFIDQLVESASLPCASCGYPVVDKALRWHPRVYVSGPLAELELGPSSRNISGARRAAERLVAAAREVETAVAVERALIARGPSQKTRRYVTSVIDFGLHTTTHARAVIATGLQ